MNIKQLFPYILFFFPILTYGQKVIPTYDQNTGGVTKIMIENDPYQMNWILAADRDTISLDREILSMGVGDFEYR